ncbi:MAG: RDD family protein [Candidatus Acidiferrales bacterium]
MTSSPSSSGGAIARIYVDDDCDYVPADMESESCERPPLVRAAAAVAGAAVKRSPAGEPPLVVRASGTGAAIGRTPVKDVQDAAAVVRAPAVAPKPTPRRQPEPEPEWRQEVARRLDAYRTRHPRPEVEAQAGLPFSLHLNPIEEFEPEAELEPEPRKEPARLAARVTRPRPSERVEISVQPELDFNASRDDRSRPQTALVPVASIEDRRWAGILDATFLLATFAGFLGLFRSLGGDILLHKVDAPVYLGAFFLLYVQYFALFTTFAGATPGMQLRGLYVVRLDGYLPDIGQLVWRSFGYVLSAGTLMLGFLWALWDEEHFTWQDRISQTYVTSGTPLGINESALGQSQQTLRR